MEATLEHGPEQAVVPSVSIENLLRRREAVLGKIDAALNLLIEARDIATAAHIGFPRLKLETNRHAFYTMLDADRIDETRQIIRKEVDGTGWQYLMTESGLRTFMDAKAREQWDKNLIEGKAPDMSLDTVRATFQALYSSRGEMFDRGVILAFKRLSWNYKTNLPCKFGKRIVVGFLRGSVTGTGKSLGHVNHSHCDEIDDLIRVFAVLDGKPEPDHRNGVYGLLNKCNTRNDPDVQTLYLSIRCFRNGNAHITFKRPDLVDEMNKILAKHYPDALPAPRD